MRLHRRRGDAGRDRRLAAQRQRGAYAAERYLNLIAAQCGVKAEVVAEDEHEGGRRAILNFGHTVGHAVEAALGYDLLHGEAVSLGMVAALSFGAARGITPPALVERARRVLTSVGLPIDVERRLDAAVLARVSVDKKRRGGKIRFVFVPAPGETRLEDVTADGSSRPIFCLRPAVRRRSDPSA